MSKKQIKPKEFARRDKYEHNREFFGWDHRLQANPKPDYDRKPNNEFKGTHALFHDCMLNAGFNVRDFDAGDDDAREQFIRYAVKRAKRPRERKCWVRLAGEWTRSQVAEKLCAPPEPHDSDEDIPF